MTNNNIDIENFKTQCRTYLLQSVSDMGNNLSKTLKQFAPTMMAENENDVTMNLISLCVISALHLQAIDDLVGNLNDKTTDKATKKRNAAMKKLIEKIYATL